MRPQIRTASDGYLPRGIETRPFYDPLIRGVYKLEKSGNLMTEMDWGRQGDFNDSSIATF